MRVLFAHAFEICSICQMHVVFTVWDADFQVCVVFAHAFERCSICPMHVVLTV